MLRVIRLPDIDIPTVPSDNIKLLVNDLRDSGQTEPISVVKLRSGRYRIEDGQAVARAAQLLGWHEIICQVTSEPEGSQVPCHLERWPNGNNTQAKYVQYVRVYPHMVQVFYVGGGITNYDVNSARIGLNGRWFKVDKDGQITDKVLD